MLKTDLQRRTEEIKRLILSGQPFEEALTRLYIELQLQAKHRWLLQTYQLLSLYVPPAKQERLCHPALLQASLLLKDYAMAKRLANILQRRNPSNPETRKLMLGLTAYTENTLPDYTPLATLSKYAASNKKFAHKSRVKHELPISWVKKMAQLSPDVLEQLSYYDKCKQLRRAPKAYRQVLQDSFDELLLNYLFQHDRAVVVLAGSFLEMLLMLHAYHTLHIRKLTCKGKDSKLVFNCSLHELIAYYYSKQLLPEKALRLCRAARMQRNYIHPGKEIMENHPLSPTGSQVCLLAVLETIDALLNTPKLRPAH